MSVLISGWLLDEYRRLKEVLPYYEEKLKGFPKGSISIRKVGNEEYAYLNYREDGKMKSEYIGSVFSSEYFEMKDKIAERNFLVKEIRNIKNQISDLEFVINGLERKERARKCRNKGKKRELNSLVSNEIAERKVSCFIKENGVDSNKKDSLLLAERIIVEHKLQNHRQDIYAGTLNGLKPNKIMSFVAKKRR